MNAPARTRVISSLPGGWIGVFEDFLESGRANVRDQILTDMQNICQGRDPKQMRVLEIGCGAGRLLPALAQVFGEVHGVDVSGEMVNLAREICGSTPNAFVYRNNGMDLSVVGHLTFDFAFSFLVFQHIPSKTLIQNYIRETHRLLRPGGLFKFQVTGCPGSSPHNDTWFGVGISEQETVDMAERCGFEMRYQYGAGDEFYWLWFFKK